MLKDSWVVDRERGYWHDPAPSLFTLIVSCIHPPQWFLPQPDLTERTDPQPDLVGESSSSISKHNSPNVT